MTLTRLPFIKPVVNETREGVIQRRRRITIAFCVLAGAIGASAVLVSFLAQTEYPRIPQHLAFIPSAVFSFTGALSAMIIATPLAYWVSVNAHRRKPVWAWWAIGMTYGILGPLLTGALLPLALVFVDLFEANIGIVTFLSDALSSLFRAPLNTVVYGTISIWTGFLAGAILGTAGWVLDVLNTSDSANVSRFGPWLTAIVIGAVLVAIAVFGDPVQLAKLG